MKMFETRAVLECYILRWAIPKSKEEDFQQAEDILRRYEESVEKDSEMKSWGTWNWSFHTALYAPANRPHMLSYIKTSNINCDRCTRLYLVFTRELHRAGQSHHELADACKSRNAEVASAALWTHITEAGAYLKEFIQRHRERHS